MSLAVTIIPYYVLHALIFTLTYGHVLTSLKVYGTPDRSLFPSIPIQFSMSPFRNTVTNSVLLQVYIQLPFDHGVLEPPMKYERFNHGTTHVSDACNRVL